MAYRLMSNPTARRLEIFLCHANRRGHIDRDTAVSFVLHNFRKQNFDYFSKHDVIFAKILCYVTKKFAFVHIVSHDGLLI
jgi:hypothetical protein